MKAKTGFMFTRDFKEDLQATIDKLKCKSCRRRCGIEAKALPKEDVFLFITTTLNLSKE